MVEPEIGDLVTFQVKVQNVVCEKCAGESPITYPDSHFLEIEHGESKGVVCKSCNASDPKGRPEIELISCVLEHISLPEPISGNFKPATGPTILEIGESREYWDELSWDILETMVLWAGKVLKFNASANRFKGIWIRPQWEGERMTGLELAGDTPSKGFELNPYQRWRLKSMGFAEDGLTNKTWKIQFQDHETGLLNASAVIFHVLKQGYLLESSDLYAFNPTLDIDLDEPEYQHLKRPKK